MRRVLISLMFVVSFFVGSCGGDDKGDSCLPEQEGVSVCRDGVILECKLDDYTYKAKWIEQYKCEDKGYYAECDDEGTYCKEEEEKDCLSNADCPSGYYCNLSNGICVWDLTSCKTTADCIRSQYCDLENPQESPITGAVSYFCKDRPRCLKESDCPMNWRCLIEERLCITDKEAEGFLCKSDEECVFSPNTKCNLGTGRCYNPDAVNTRNTGNTEDIGDTDHSGFFGDKDE